MALLLSLFCFVAYAQKTVTGTVKDAQGEPLIGVTVQLPNGQGAVTDIDGNFRLTNVKSTDKLTISYVGCKTQVITVGSQTTFNVVMQSNDKSLDEVVVIGYGTMKRRDLTGAVASVTGEELAKNPVSNVAEALQGQLPGVNVISQDGRPGATVSIRVRGGGSITQSNEPLYVVDGIQVSGIDDIPADNIESIDVLKDAASTAIYGARGANGVILITTKTGQKGKPTVKYNAYYQLQQAPDKLDVMDAYDYVLWTWSYATAYGASYGDHVAKYFGLGSKYGNHLSEYKSVTAHNYMDDIMQNSHTWNHDLSLSGGTEHNQYYATIDYTNGDGTRLNTGFRRWNGNFKFAQDITKNLKLDLDLRYTEMRFRGTRWEYATSVYAYKPVDNPLGENPDPSDFGQGSAAVEDNLNPVALVNNYDNINLRHRIRANGALTWKVIKGLTARTELTLGRNWREQQNWDGGLEDTKPTAKLTKDEGYNVRWTSTVNYAIPGLGKDHKADIMAGNEVLASKSSTSIIYGSGYPEEWDMEYAFANMRNTNPALGEDQFNNSVDTPTHTLSWFGRANYSYLGRYLLTATLRADGSSKFAPNHHWGYFPAFAAGWRISDEPFMAGTQDWLSNLKLRLSYGTSGADNIDASLWKATWTTSSKTVDGVVKTIYVPGSMKPNPDLKWESTTSRNLGLDYGFWNGRLRGSLDFYWNSTNNILMKVPVDSSTGYSYQFQNVGKTSNKGFELSLAYDIFQTKDFNLRLTVTHNYNKNNVDELYDGVNTDTATGWGSTMRKPYYDYIIREGRPVGLIQGFKSAGWYTLDDFDYNNGVYTLKKGVPDTKEIVNYAGGSNFKLANGQTAFPGMVKFEDVSKDGVIDNDDVTILAETQAKHTGGFNISGNWKSIDFMAGFVYQIGGNIYNANVMHDMMGNKDNMLGSNRLAEVAETFRIYDVDANGDLFAVTDPTALAALNANAKYALPYCEYGLVNSEFIEDASYLRLQTLTVGYTLPRTWTKKVGISNLRIYATGSNLFTLTGYSGLDPSINTAPGGSNGFPTPNYDYHSYPRSRSFTFGLNVTF